MLKFSEDRAFVDDVDGQLVALAVETGAYYTFNEAATAVVGDLNAGWTVPEIAAALSKLDADAPAKLDAFVAQLVATDLVDEVEDEVAADRPDMACASLADDGGGLELCMDGYDDVAAYFMIDPIHEVDPDAGWPTALE